MTMTMETHRHLHCVVRLVKNVWQADEQKCCNTTITVAPSGE